MPNLRVTTDQTYTMMRSKMQHANQAVVNTWSKISDGTRIQTPSDDPSGAVRLLCIERISSSVSQYIENVNNTSDKLTLEENQINAMEKQLRRCRELALLANNDTVDAMMRSGLSVEIESITESLVSLVNTQSIDGRYIFGGFDNDVEPIAKGTSCHSNLQGYEWDFMVDTSVKKEANAVIPQTLYLTVDDQDSDIVFSGKESSSEVATKVSAVYGLTASPSTMQVVMTLPSKLSMTDSLKVKINGRELEFVSNDVRDIQKQLDKIITLEQRMTAKIDNGGAYVTFEVFDGMDLQLEHSGGAATTGQPQQFIVQPYSIHGNPMPSISVNENEYVSCAAAISMDIDPTVNSFSYINNLDWQVLSEPVMQIGGSVIEVQDLEFRINGNIYTIELEDQDTSAEVAHKIGQINGITAAARELEAAVILPQNLTVADDIKFSVNGVSIVVNDNNAPSIQKALDKLFPPNQSIHAEVDKTGTKIQWIASNGIDLKIIHEGGSSTSGPPQNLGIELMDKKGKKIDADALRINEEMYLTAEIDLIASVSRGVHDFEYKSSGNFGPKELTKVVFSGRCSADKNHNHAYILNNQNKGFLNVRIDQSSSIRASDSASDFCAFKVSKGGWKGKEISMFDLLFDLQTTLQKSDSGNFHYNMSCIIECIDQSVDNVLFLQTELGGRQSVLEMTRTCHEDATYYWNLIASELRDLDYADAVAKATEEMLVLDAIRHSFQQISSKTLFDYLF